MKHLILLFFLLVAAGTTRSFAQFNALDNTFNGGIVTTSVSTDDEFARAVAIQPDGKIVLAGNVSFNGAYADFALARYNSNGTLDNGFAYGGKLTTAIGESDDIANAVAIQPDGKIIAAGYSYVGEHFDFALARYNADGVPDKSFNTDGKLISSVGKFNDVINSIAVQPDGKIVAAGYSSDGIQNHFAIVRYNIDGTLDRTFNSTGFVVLPIGSGNSEISSVCIQPDGKIIAAGFSDNNSKSNFTLARLNQDGTFDQSFNFDGEVITS
ncbi:MAG: delta-60 repeat domain-containing protein, partial [Chitinophagales bacterium]